MGNHLPILKEKKMKKQLKTYSIMGQISCSMVFRMRMLRFRINFDGGSLTSQGVIPAIYKTSDPLIQHVIEQSSRYKNGTISIQSVVDLAEDIPENEVVDESDLDVTPASVKEASSEGGSDKTEYPEITNFQSAKSILMSKPYNVPLSELQTKEALIKKAEELNVSFPNMK